MSIAGAIEDEIVECLRRTQPLVAGIELNISSPNTAGLRIFQEPGRLRGLIEGLVADKQAPLFVKLPPWPRDTDNRRDILKLAETAVAAGADGLVIANTHPIESHRLKVGRGGLSGAPLFEHTELMIADIQALVQGNAAIIACGGVSTAEQVWKLMASGASAVQLYTSFIYEGPGLPSRLNHRLVKLMSVAGIETVADITGPPPIVKRPRNMLALTTPQQRLGLCPARHRLLRAVSAHAHRPRGHSQPCRFEQVHSRCEARP